MDDFYAARSGSIPPLPWSNFAPPFSSIPYSTIRTWMLRDYRHIAAKIGKDDDFKGKGGLRSSHHTSSLQDKAMQGLDQAQHAFQSTVDPDVRGEIISRMDQLLADMKQAGNWRLPPAPDF
ncbi:hypothetical protein [Microvirga ossetica]|uniref:hypothetical protein n=1 Tax=Microvirga ossetica TaxID=1882682 RepID=UPI0013000CAE|nr:hypothetical protein [Microvirga ossetica]